ncbi:MULTISPECIES: RraA family protein [Burkholderia]|uniref:RraA family protein n=1 Tax=Burkholderia TaxID=32008 RepID=UPI0004FFDC3F|nr:dimethylmenaquinone methyltransferase [Burkholderia pyrrocinia]EKS9883425.1 dimethylmenaquinone methyltransferase [Burkholderia pyrrocinia]EKS9893121.1 dimethylmenaquinone methyltransferase [Burkholderia pyrrocinia]EKS9908895.1 dimethylmenaquinone methyltransferase [Burkholderia pyrrocinia]KFL54072.1 dimethylmenaquinone methyltransferase [Burkholderia pyrrocinia]TDA48463.1 dimethylmenaquinone methyltransferase [Burkholderia pyrrocinia]
MSTINTYGADLLDQARALGTSTLYEASGLTTSSVDPAIRTVWSGASVAGPAYPLECSPGDNLSIHIAMEQVPRGSVLVVSTGGFVSGYWGEVLTVAAEAAGVAGLVIDGGVRDIAALVVRRFPVFTRGISMRGTIKASAPSVGQPLSFAGTPVAAGDLVVADDDGVLVIPMAHVERTLTQGQARADKEARMMDALRAGRSTLDLMGLTNWRAAR